MRATGLNFSPRAARRPRPAFLADLAVLLPFELALSGEEKEQGADGIAWAILEVCSWWS